MGLDWARCNYYHYPIEHKILIIEDEQDLAAIMRAALVKQGHRVHHSLEAETGFSVYRKTRFDLILLDVTLPGLSGLEFLRLIRSESQIPVVLMSGRLTAAHRAFGLKLGAHDCLHKPFTIPALLACVTRSLGAPAH